VSSQLLSHGVLLPLNCEGCFNSTITTDGGAFLIAFNIDHSKLYNTQDEEIPVGLYFSKVTNGTIHEYLCNNGLDICDSENDHILYLSHLQLRNLLPICDDTVIPFSGRILIAETLSTIIWSHYTRLTEIYSRALQYTNGYFDCPGRPKDLSIRQENGNVVFQFTNNSYGEEAYDFTRSLEL
jgi:hypothetical protein